MKSCKIKLYLEKICTLDLDMDLGFGKPMFVEVTFGKAWHWL